MEPREQSGTQTAIHVPSGEGDSLWTLGQLLTFKVHGVQSETVGIFEIEVPPEGAAPPHLHPSQDETHYILEGQFDFVLGDRRITAGPGSVVYVPRKTVPAYTNTGTEMGKILFIEAPAGPFERFLEETGEPVTDPSSPQGLPPDMDKLQASAQRTGGVEIVAPPRKKGDPE
jgi:mannose-6-phosphate isomerase-like protein (cupin superfamily)